MDDGVDQKPYVAAGREVLPLLRAGLSMRDVEKVARAEDVRTLASVAEEVHRQDRIRRLLAKLDFAEAMNHAFVGSQPGRENQAAYGRWLRAVEAEVAELRGQTVPTIWDSMPRSRRIRKLRRR